MPNDTLSDLPTEVIIFNQPVKIDQPAANIFHLTFQTQQAITETLLRFEEHYESPVFRGQIFTLDKFKEWYIATSAKGQETGRFTYYTDWNGFNIPSSAMEPFVSGEFNPLSDAEQSIVNTFAPLHAEGITYYIIASHLEKPETAVKKHEIGHGLFFTNPEYQAQVKTVLNSLSDEIRVKINHYLSELGGYHPDVYEDETHAYILTEMYRVIDQCDFSPDQIDEIKKARTELIRIFSAYCELPTDKNAEMIDKILAKTQPGHVEGMLAEIAEMQKGLTPEMLAKFTAAFSDEKVSNSIARQNNILIPVAAEGNGNPYSYQVYSYSGSTSGISTSSYEEAILNAVGTVDDLKELAQKR